MVVLLNMVSIAVHSLLLLVLLIIMSIGVMVLLYHLKLLSSFYCDYFYQANGTKYSMRGGSIEKGFECGSFYIRIASGNNYTGWDYGASLSFKLIN